MILKEIIKDLLNHTINEIKDPDNMTKLQMDILDKKHKVVVIEDSPYEKKKEKIRA